MLQLIKYTYYFLNYFLCRRSLVLELKTTRELLSTSLSQVQDLELKSQTVPMLENRIQELEKNMDLDKR